MGAVAGLREVAQRAPVPPLGEGVPLRAPASLEQAPLHEPRHVKMAEVPLGAALVLLPLLPVLALVVALCALFFGEVQDRVRKVARRVSLPKLCWYVTPRIWVVTPPVVVKDVRRARPGRWRRVQKNRTRVAPRVARLVQ